MTEKITELQDELDLVASAHSELQTLLHLRAEDSYQRRRLQEQVDTYGKSMVERTEELLAYCAALTRLPEASPPSEKKT